MYATRELMKRSTDLRQKPDKHLRLAQRRYKEDYARRVRFAPIFPIGDYVFLGRPPLPRSAVEWSASEGYNKILPRNKDLIR